MKKIYALADPTVDTPFETNYWTVYQAESTFSDFCRFSPETPLDAKEKGADFIWVHFIKDYDPAYQGFVHFCKKNYLFDGLPYNKRPIVNADEVREAELAERAAAEVKENAEITEAPASVDFNHGLGLCENDKGEPDKQEQSIKETMQEIFAEADIRREKARKEYEKRKLEEAEKSVDQKKKVKPKVQKNVPVMKTVRTSKLDNLLKQYCDMVFYKKDYYLSANRFRTTYKREEDQLFGYSNIVIDIDYHVRWGQKIRQEDICKKLNHLMCALETQFYAPLDFYTPNSVVFTGRGLQLWWSLENTHARARKMYQDVVDYFCDRLEEFIKADPELEGITIDRSASKNAAGLYRMPCTYNTATGGYGDVYLRHKNLMNLYDAYDEIFRSGYLAPKKYQKRIQFSYDGGGDFRAAAERRIDALAEIVCIRAAKGEKITRDLFLLIVFCAVISATGDEKLAYKRMLAFNRLFPVPMPEAEAIRYMSTAGRKKYYYRNITVISLLDITEEEQKQTGFRPARSQRKAKHPGFRKNHSDLDTKILKLCADGMNRAQIAKECGCSAQTVSRVLKANKKKTEGEILHKKVYRSARAGKSVQKLLREYGDRMSRSNIYRLCKMASVAREEAKRLKEKRQEILKKKRKTQEAKQEAEAVIISDKNGTSQSEDVRIGFAFSSTSRTAADKELELPAIPTAGRILIA